MTTERRSYRQQTTAAPAPEREAAPTRQAAPRQQQQSRGSNSNFKTITGLFLAKSGKADTVFVTPEIAEKLHAIQPGDTLGVSINQKTNRPALWYIEGDGGSE